ncbi:cyclin family protein, partial [Salmonella sp. s51228]|uniref:cyclin family protein n=1 Tax=Salmonella sp. s51228 TaxID=3159652 RepID=UPI00397FDB3C
LLAPTTYMFIQAYIIAARPHDRETAHSLAEYICELVLLHHTVALKYKPSMLAAAAVSLACYTLNEAEWSNALTLHTGYMYEELLQCREELQVMHRSSSTLQQQAIQEKFRSTQHKSVANIQPRTY